MDHYHQFGELSLSLLPRKILDKKIEGILSTSVCGF